MPPIPERLESGKAGETLPAGVDLGGATATLAPQASDVRAEVRRLTRGDMADVVFEMTGSPDAIPLSRSVKPPVHVKVRGEECFVLVPKNFLEVRQRTQLIRSNKVWLKI